jgi:hypothetical protein
MACVNDKRSDLMSRKGFLVVLILITMSAFTLPVWADLPPRPDDEPAHKSVAGGGILLHVGDYREGLWAIVQWQDGLGNWHDVEGWRGMLDQDWHVWWVDEKDFGTGPFRWVLHDGPGGEQLGVSESFDLPHSNGEIRHITVLLSP